MLCMVFLSLQQVGAILSCCGAWVLEYRPELERPSLVTPRHVESSPTKDGTRDPRDGTRDPRDGTHVPCIGR